MEPVFKLIDFIRNATEEPVMTFHIPQIGLTESQIKEWERKYEEIVVDYGKANNNDYEDFDHQGALEEAADRLGIQYAKPDYTSFI